MTCSKFLSGASLFALLTASSHLSAQSFSCDGYRLFSETVATAGGQSSGGSYSLVDIAGQAAVGSISFGPAYFVSAGDLDALKDPLPIWSTYAAWKQAFFTPTQQNDTSVSGFFGDGDQDEVVNLLEYATGSDPTSAASAARPTVSSDPTHASITYTRSIAASDVTFTVDESNDLLTWAPVSATNSLLCDDGFVQTMVAEVPRTDGDPTGKLFLRLRVSLP